MIPFLLACAAPPDLVLVTVDTTRRDALGAYGGPATPGIDGLAAEGVRYDHAWTVAPLTLPAHAAILTGRWPTSTGVHDNGDHVLGDNEHTLAERLAAAGYHTAGMVGASVLGADWGFAQGFATFDAPKTAERPGAEVVDEALAWLAATDAPIFLWVHLYDPHAPHPDVPGDPYLAEVATADAQVGRLLDALRARPNWEHTGVVIAADHGEGRGDHGEREHGALIFASTTEVPLVVRPPGGSAARVDEHRVSLVDIAPTMLGWAGVSADGVDGQPLDAPERPVFVESRQLARHLGWSPLAGLVDADGFWMRGAVLRRYDADERLVATGGEAPTALVEHYAASVDQGQSPSATQLAALAALGYLDTEGGGDGRVDPVDGIAGYEALRDAASALDRNDLPAAAAAFALAQQVDPHGPAVRLVGVGLRARTDPAGALTDAAALVADAPSARARASYGELLLRNGRPAEAVAQLREAVANLPDAHLTGLFGWALAETGDPHAADVLERALSADPTQPLLWGLRGKLALTAGDPAGALPWLEQEISRHPPALEARKLQVQALLATARWHEAVVAVDALEAARPPDAGSAFARAVALHALGDAPGASAALHRCLAYAPAPAVCVDAEAGRWGGDVLTP